VYAKSWYRDRSRPLREIWHRGSDIRLTLKSYSCRPGRRVSETVKRPSHLTNQPNNKRKMRPSTTYLAAATLLASRSSASPARSENQLVSCLFHFFPTSSSSPPHPPSLVAAELEDGRNLTLTQYVGGDYTTDVWICSGKAQFALWIVSLFGRTSCISAGREKARKSVSSLMETP
jgi:hypothetical protein